MSNWNDPQNRFIKENEQYDLNTPFGSLEKNPFKSPDANESKDSKLEYGRRILVAQADLSQPGMAGRHLYGAALRRNV